MKINKTKLKQFLKYNDEFDRLELMECIESYLDNRLQIQEEIKDFLSPYKEELVRIGKDKFGSEIENLKEKKCPALSINGRLENILIKAKDLPLNYNIFKPALILHIFAEYKYLSTLEIDRDKIYKLHSYSDLWKTQELERSKLIDLWFKLFDKYL